MQTLWILLVFSLLVSAPAGEPTLEAPILKTKPKRIAVFKDGLGFVLRSGEADVKNSVAELDPLPAAALGALWFSTDDPAHRISEVTSFRRQEKVSVPAVNLFELLRANIGRRARISYATGPAAGALAHVEAEIMAVPDDRSVTPAAALESPDYLSVRRWSHPLPPSEPSRGELVLLRNSSNEIVALQKHSIHSVLFAEAELNNAVSKEVVRTRIRFDQASGKRVVNLSYLQKGWNWSPSYLIDLKSEKEASLTLEAVLANDVEDLEEAEISFVVGYPNFAFADLAHPLSSGQSIAELVQAIVARSQDHSQPNRGFMVQNAMAYSDASVSASYSPGDLVRDADQASEDFFFFRQPSVTLGKGGRARFTLINATVPYEHIYEWRLGETPQPNPYDAREERQREKENEVWHTIRFTNITRQPFTTAPALAVNGQLPIAQDTLKYTPPGASSSLRITVASDVRASEATTELSRTPITIAGSTGVKVSLRNELTVRNFKKSPIKLAIHRTLRGEVSDNASAEIRNTGRDLSSLNPTQTITWNLELAAGEEKKVDFNYTTIVAR
jgi:hypothetical protein